MQTVRKAVIAAAGFGTRFLPQTKAIPKEMLPIIDKPVIQLVVEGVVAAGVTDVIIVTGQGKRAIEDHFDRALGLEQELRAKGKTDQADEIQRIAELANIVYVRQKGEPKGNARPVLNAAHLIDNEPFFYFFADDFFTGSGPSCAAQMLESYKKTGKTIAALRKVKREDASKYGMVELGEQIDQKTFRINKLVEKPGPEKTPSEYAVVCGYLLTPDIIPMLAQEKVAPDGEIRVPDTVNELAQIDKVYGCLVDGDYHDTGSPELYLETLIDIALKDPQLSDRLRDYIKDRL
ncbi:UTP--glucose-1-phosphate uridylyltransferase [bacterium]|nr:UTP--glucose-1-phosphate uridylyltransferase [bacterium]NBX98448.1 UTP--glucose-1-phosphate uridylyltransferase [bacterium]NDC94110.1 UTP--glucose-1-phosphate uridylyltransferase [bacterium]NDD83349.1 UTP--glucose-1-phosphate uridylyltransferase [bacterium]NDG28927.1 UTP--glucose-1-phosphate uridylyltransferase [bacterium]